ncbi:MAG TPA: sigma-70 family RNA polymerase sigma factor [Tepidisphaeraceae bacterium]|jgi:RNA polymerase sigma factor (sigma-70 family)
MAMDDSQLLAAYARDRSAAVMQQLVERHIDFVYAAALRQTGNLHAAQDITQAVFLLFSQRAMRLKPGTLLKGWLFNATRYVVSNARRAEVRRKLHEREAAAMRSEMVREDRLSDISPHLDDALASLSEKDRRVLLMRFFEDLPMAALGQAMGISEGAAQKRVAHALSRLKHFLAGRRASFAGTSVDEILRAGLAIAAPVELTKSTIHLAINGASSAAHSGSAVSLAKGAAKMMNYARAKVLAIQCAIAGASIGTVVVLAAPQLRSISLNRPGVVAMANAPAAKNTAEQDYAACRQTLTSIVDGYDHNDAAAVQAFFYFPAGTNRKAIDNFNHFLEADVSAYHLANVNVSRFGMHGTTLNIGLVSTNAVYIMDILSRIGPQSARVRGESLELTPAAPSGPYVGCWQNPLYFVRDQGVWKLDAERNFRLTFSAYRRKPIAGETPEQACAASIELIVERFSAITNDIQNGTIVDELEAKKRVNAVFVEVDSQFRDDHFGMDH